MLLRWFISCALVSVILGDKKLFNPCKLDDSKCLIEEATKVQNVVIHGYKPLKIPKYTPFTIPLVEIEGNGLYVKIEPIYMTGYDVLKFQEIKLDLDKQTLFFKAFVTQGKLAGPYHLKGKFGPLAIDGQGDANILIDNIIFKFNANFTFVEKKDKKYIKISNTDTKFDMTKVTFDFGNIVKGNPELTKATNDALNADWQVVVDALGGGIEKVVNGAFALPLVKIMDHVPLDELVIT